MGSSKHLEVHSETSDQAMNDKHVKISHGTHDESVSSKHSDSSPGTIDRSGNSMHSEGANPDMILESDRNYDFNTLIDDTGNQLISDKSSSSVSSSESSSDDLLQVDPVFSKSESSTASYYNNIRPELKDELNDLSSQSSANSESDSSSPGPTSTSQDYDAIPDLIEMIPTSVPPVQVMDRLGGYDPFRIPSSVFARNKSNNPMDWSMASNDSLFSIQLGNDSFTKDHLYMLGELSKSGELTKSGELLMFSSHPPVILEGSQTTEVAYEDFKSEQRAGEDEKEVKKSHPSISCLPSNVSSISHASKSMHGHHATVLIVAGCSVTKNGQAVVVQIVVGRSATLGTVAIKRRPHNASPILTQAESVNSAKVGEAPEVTSNSTACSYCCQCFSWSCCSLGNCCSWGNCCQFRCHCPCCNCHCCHYHCC